MVLVGCTASHAGRLTSSSTPLGHPSSSGSIPNGTTAGEHDSWELLGVACASGKFCVAVGEQDVVNQEGRVVLLRAGVVLTSADPAGGARTWKVANVGSAAGVGGFVGPIVCPSANLCIAVGGGGAGIVTSGDPTGGGAAWFFSPIDGDSGGVDRISCASSSFCAAVDNDGRVLVSVDPSRGASAWHVSQLVDRNFVLNGISCPGRDFCAAVDNFGHVLISSSPRSDRVTWKRFDVDTTYAPLYDVDCPSVLLCVATDGSNDVVASTHPAGGPSMWAVGSPLITNRGHALYTLTCASSSLCVALDQAGGAVFTSVHPAQVTSPWREAELASPQQMLDGIACPSLRLCVVTSTDGDVYTSTNPGGVAPEWRRSVLKVGPS